MRACVRKCAGIPLVSEEMKGKEQKVVLWERGLFCVWEKDNMREIFTIYISIKLFHISSVSTVHVFNNQIDTEEPSPSHLVLTRYPLFSYYYTPFFLNLFIWVLSFLPMHVYIFLFFWCWVLFLYEIHWWSSLFSGIWSFVLMLVSLMPKLKREYGRCNLSNDMISLLISLFQLPRTTFANYM